MQDATQRTPACRRGGRGRGPTTRADPLQRAGPGTRLNQAEIAEELGVSRIPVRDALYQLAAEGLVRLNGRAGATVSELSVADLQELYELREAIEPLASRLAPLTSGGCTCCA